MEVDNLKYIPQWGDKLIDRVKQAGISSITTDNVGDIEELYHIGKKRIQYLEYFLDKYNPDKIVEKTDEFIIQKTEDKLFDIFFSNTDNSLEMARVEVISENRVKGQILFKSKDGEDLYRLKFKTTQNAIRPYGNEILSTSAQKLIWRVSEIALARAGQKFKTVSTRI